MLILTWLFIKFERDNFKSEVTAPQKYCSPQYSAEETKPWTFTTPDSPAFMTRYLETEAHLVHRIVLVTFMHSIYSVYVRYSEYFIFQTL
jgi:hypothetical protein